MGHDTTDESLLRIMAYGHDSRHQITVRQNADGLPSIVDNQQCPDVVL